MSSFDLLLLSSSVIEGKEGFSVACIGSSS